MSAAEELGQQIADLQKQVAVLERASQAQHSTVETAAGTLGLGDAAATAVDTAAALPAIEESADTAQATADSLAVMADGWDDGLNAYLEEMAADLDDATSQLEDSQADIEDAFGATVDGLSDDVETAITAAGDAKTEAQAASDAALAAAGLAASKGKTIVQVSAPTGSNADPANLWININTDSNEVPKNQPNRYNPDTAKWEPITDAQAVAAAQAAAAAVAAAQAAKDVADQANAAAGVAKTAADNANTAALQAAGIANGKGKVIYQASKPTGANAAAGNLWIRTSDNTPWTYDATSSDWVQVTDQTAKDAATAAAAAQTAATAAANAAKAAQATADAKPLILFSSSAGPSGTAPTGSIWFLWDSAKNVAGQWLQEGTLAAPVWTPQQIRSEVIANLDVAKLTAGSAAIADLVAQKIAASTANFQTANVSNLFVTSGATMSQAVIDFLFVNVVQAKKITAGMIDVSTLNGVSITGLSIVGGYFQTTASDATGSRTTVSGGVLKVDNTKNGGSSTIYCPGAYLRIQSTDGSGSYATLDITPTSDISVPAFVFSSAIKVLNGGVFTNRLSDPSGVLLANKNTDGWVVYASDYRLADGTSILADTGWIAITAASGLTATNFAFRIRQGDVEITGQIKINSGSFPNGYTTLGTMPVGARPQNYLRIPIGMFNGYTALLVINTNGAMQIGASSDRTADTVYLGGSGYPADR